MSHFVAQLRNASDAVTQMTRAKAPYLGYWLFKTALVSYPPPSRALCLSASLPLTLSHCQTLFPLSRCFDRNRIRLMVLFWIFSLWIVAPWRLKVCQNALKFYHLEKGAKREGGRWVLKGVKYTGGGSGCRSSSPSLTLPLLKPDLWKIDSKIVYVKSEWVYKDIGGVLLSCMRKARNQNMLENVRKSDRNMTNTAFFNGVVVCIGVHVGVGDFLFPFPEFRYSTTIHDSLGTQKPIITIQWSRKQSGASEVKAWPSEFPILYDPISNCSESQCSRWLKLLLFFLCSSFRGATAARF